MHRSIDAQNLLRSAVNEIAWPAICAPVGASLLAMQYQLEQSQWWPPDKLQKYQFLQFGKVLKHALKTVPYYRDSFSGVGRGADAAKWDYASFRELPFLHRQDIMAASTAMHSESVPEDHGKLLEYATSGSTGVPIRGYDTEVSHFLWSAFNLRDHLWRKRDFSSRFAAIRTKVKTAEYRTWGVPVDSAFESGSAATLDISTNVDAQLDWLEDFKPAYTLTHTSNLEALARAAKNRQIELPGLREVATFGEMLKPGLRRLCREAWPGVLLVDMYTSEELGYIALQCPETERYHLQAENLLIEILDDDDRPCKPGQVGRVVATTLNNFAMPLIRYVIGDYAEVGGPCSCGRGLPVISRIMGRQRNMMVLPDNTQHWPSFPAELWLDVAPFRQFQLVQRETHRIEARYVLDGRISPEQERTLIEKLRHQLGFPFTIDLKPVTEIAGGSRYKFEDFISTVDPERPSD